MQIYGLWYLFFFVRLGGSIKILGWIDYDDSYNFFIWFSTLIPFLLLLRFCVRGITRRVSARRWEVVGSMLGPNRDITKDVKNCSYCCYVRCVTLIVWGFNRIIYDLDKSASGRGKWLLEKEGLRRYGVKGLLASAKVNCRFKPSAAVSDLLNFF